MFLIAWDLFLIEGLIRAEKRVFVFKPLHFIANSFHQGFIFSKIDKYLTGILLVKSHVHKNKLSKTKQSVNPLILTIKARLTILLFINIFSDKKLIDGNIS